MGRKLSRGKQQILFNYLPGKTFDFPGATIAKISKIRGTIDTNLNQAVLLRRISDEVLAWDPEYRPTLRDDVLSRSERFVCINPTSADAEMYPLVFWCQNRECGRVFDRTRRDRINNLEVRCPVCKVGKLEQLRFVKVHRCGALEPLTPPVCKQCGTNGNYALDARSERLSNFRWICRKCHKAVDVTGFNLCPECRWPGEPKSRLMSIEVHRASKTYYVHYTALLNIPNRRLDPLFNNPDWPALVAGKYFGLTHASSQSLSDLASSSSTPKPLQDVALTTTDLEGLMRRFREGKITAEQFVNETETIQSQRASEPKTQGIAAVIDELIRRTGLDMDAWKLAGQELLEAQLPFEDGYSTDVLDRDEDDSAKIAKGMGFSSIKCASDFPIINASYGFSRTEFAPNQCWLRPFPEDRDIGGRLPIYVDTVQADALLMTLDYERVCRWLEVNTYTATIPQGSDQLLSKRAYFVSLFNSLQPRRTLDQTAPQGRMVFGLLHTLSHLCLRQATLLCGLEHTSLSEYLLPRTLTFALYGNQRSGATIGALTALFEQSLSQWLNSIRDNRMCVYDPVCREHEGSCHACSHLAETSCRFFNLNLNRAFLYGGHDPELGEIAVGFFDPRL